MATVRLTGQLRSAIRRKIADKFEHLENMAIKPLDDTFGDRVYMFAFRKYKTHMDAVPDQFYRTNDGMYVNLRGHIDTHTYNRVNCTFTQQRRLPNDIGSYYSAFNITNQALYDEYAKHAESSKEVDKEKTMVLNAFDEVSSKCSTLKKLLQIMPEIETFIPAPYMRTHYEKTEPVKRTRKDASDVEVDDNVKNVIAKLKFSSSL